jgi:hypothetical protein
MDDQSSIIAKLETQEATSDLIASYRTSERGDFRVIAALATIERENAEAAREAVTVSRHACGGTAPPENAPPPANQGVADPTRGQVPTEHARRAQHVGRRVIRRLRVGKATDLSPKPRRVSSPPVALKRTARARAVHSHASHGGVRKAADDGGGSSDGGGNPPFHKHEPGAALAGVAL